MTKEHLQPKTSSPSISTFLSESWPRNIWNHRPVYQVYQHFYLNHDQGTFGTTVEFTKNINISIWVMTKEHLDAEEFCFCFSCMFSQSTGKVEIGTFLFLQDKPILFLFLLLFYMSCAVSCLFFFCFSFQARKRRSFTNDNDSNYGIMRRSIILML